MQGGKKGGWGERCYALVRYEGRANPKLEKF